MAVIGTGSIKIADPKELKNTREWWDKTWPRMGGFGGFGPASITSACAGCGLPRQCHNRNRAHSQDSDDCAESTWYSLVDHQTPTIINQKGTDICQKLSLNAMETCFMGPMSFPTDHNKDFPIQPRVPAYTALGWYMKKMYDMGIIGPGTKYDTSPLPMDAYKSEQFMEIYGIALANRIGIGDLLAEGTARFAEKLGRTDDFNTLCRLTMWGYQDHWSMPGVEWAYGNLLDSRDINNHDMSVGTKRGITCEQFVNILAERTLANDPYWFDYSWQGEQAYKTGIYSEHTAKWVAWHQHYWNYYKESVGFCDWGYSQLYNQAHPRATGAA